MHVETKTNVLLLFWTFLVTRRKNRDNDVPSTRHGLCVRQECSLNTTRLVFQTWVFPQHDRLVCRTWVFPQHDTACVSDMSMICVIFFIVQLFINHRQIKKSTYGIYCYNILLEICTEICISTKTWLRKRSECTRYSTTECHCIMFDIDQDVILFW